ncbi:hypothetical protein [Flavobacterium xinjiangense]|uniref:hypothetical protein n=1 Tax=Flavobacterium xinjiangense TaxID=178356 RepID=UPI0011147F9B|nr:hypothetical protein [Flavobacterium xinjiangense]
MIINQDGEITAIKTGKTFTVYMCVEGSFEIECNNSKWQYEKGDTVLIPAAMKTFVLNGKAST